MLTSEIEVELYLWLWHEMIDELPFDFVEIFADNVSVGVIRKFWTFFTIITF